MWRLVASVILLAAATACGARNEKAVTQFSLTSDAFQNGAPIPKPYSCDGADQSPPLAWSEPPAGTKSFALVIDDPDAPSGTFHHWGAYDIPAITRSIAAGQAVGSQAINDFGKPGFGGPCPPPGHGPHHYHFKLFALDVDRLGLQPNAKVAEVESAAKQHAIGRGELIGTYERK
jgi:Raf kinase inhibitor-like YbhB/YbcL family protein